MSDPVALIPIDRDGTPRGFAGVVPEAAAEVLRATVTLYADVGFEEPWIGYLAVAGPKAVGVCGFKSPPREGRVEIAYFTFPGCEGRGYATRMAGDLIDLARKAEPAICVTAQTLPDRNASHRVLEKLGFNHRATLDHPQDGAVWEWRLESAPAI